MVAIINIKQNKYIATITTSTTPHIMMIDEVGRGMVLAILNGPCLSLSSQNGAPKVNYGHQPPWLQLCVNGPFKGPVPRFVNLFGRF